MPLKIWRLVEPLSRVRTPILGVKWNPLKTFVFRRIHRMLSEIFMSCEDLNANPYSYDIHDFKSDVVLFLYHFRV